ncbi:myosin tail region-interacting protein MTI1, partial [Phenoliferia sp. Uapishka_3]
PSRSAPPPQQHGSPGSSKQSSVPPSKRQSTGAGAAEFGLLGVAIPRGSIDLDRDGSSPSSPIAQSQPLAQQASRSSVTGNFKARDLDLELGSQWWRAVPFSPPTSIKARKDVACEVSQSTSTKRGKTRHDNEIEVIFDDFSKTLISVAFTDEDLAESTTAITQAHAAPPPFPSPQALSSFSSTLGAQIFAAAHSKSADKSRTTTESFISFCLSRATDPLPPIGYTFGLTVFTHRVAASKGAAAQEFEVDEPRAGDVVVFWDAKFKHNLSTQKVGSSEVPHVAVVQAWDSKKRKLRALEVGKDGAVDEGAWRMEDLKGGSVTVYRAVERSWLDGQ